MGSLMGIVYATGSKIPRRIRVSDDERAVRSMEVGEGESLIVVPSARIDAPEASQIVAAETGVDVHSIPSGRCAIVDPKTRLVVGVTMADPEIDSHPDGEIHASDVAGPNWKHDGKKFLARFVVVPESGKTDAVAVADVVWLDLDSVDSPIPDTVLLKHSDANIGDEIKVAAPIDEASVASARSGK